MAERPNILQALFISCPLRVLPPLPPWTHLRLIDNRGAKVCRLYVRHTGGHLILFLPATSRTNSSLEPQVLESVSSNNIWASDGEALFADDSSHLFSLYLSYAEKHDKEQVENWIAGADGILVFVRVVFTRLHLVFLLVLIWPHTRLVFSLRHSPRLLSTAINPYYQTQAATLSRSSHRYPSNSPMDPKSPPYLRYPICPHSSQLSPRS